MPLPLVPVVAGLGALGIGSQFLGGQKQQRFQERQARDQKIAARRAAIERAMGGTSISRMAPQAEAPDTSNYAALAGLANLGSSLMMLNGGAPKTPPPPQVYT